MFLKAIVTFLFLFSASVIGQRSSLSTSHRHSHKFSHSKQPRVKTLDSQIDDTVKIFKRNVLRLRNNTKLDLIFVIDASYSVQLHNFKDELRFVSRFVGGIPVSVDTTRVAVITFADYAQTWVDQVTANNVHDHKCSLLGTSLPRIEYASGSTYTLGALQQAQEIMNHARVDSKKVILLITDGRSNGGDPRSIARRLKAEGVEIFTFGVHSGNVEELTYMASDPKQDHVYILKSFAEFESVARRALHADVEAGDYVTEEDRYCDRFCNKQESCCHSEGACRCGTTTGLYECVCNAGFFGLGLLPDGCMACPEGTYKPLPTPGGPETCTLCPDLNMVSPNGSSSLEQCTCKTGYIQFDHHCDIIRCPEIEAPENGRFEGLLCDNQYKSICRIVCYQGYDLVGSQKLKCTLDGTWRTDENDQIEQPSCQVRHCPELSVPLHASLNCSKSDFSYKTQCLVVCDLGFVLRGSLSRYCQANAAWDGIESECAEIRCHPPSPPMGGRISKNCEIPLNATLPFGETCNMFCPDGFALSVLNQSRCVDTDTWSTDTSEAKCIDVEPPIIDCPDDIEVTASPFSSTTKVTWFVANASDNSNNVTLTMIPAVNQPALFPIGTFNITYRAEDSEGLSSYCLFRITIIDTEPPIIDRCSDPEPVVISDDQNATDYAVWIEPSFTDNSGIVIVNKSRNFGYLPFGQTKVFYEARDPTGNVRTCVITVSVQYNLCPPLNNPEHGHQFCSLNSAHLVECELTCDSLRYGMALAEYGSILYTCGEHGEWQPEDHIPKDCSYQVKLFNVMRGYHQTHSLQINKEFKYQRYSNHIEQGYRVQYSMAPRNNCDDDTFLESVRLKCVDYLSPRISTWCRSASIDINCTLVSVSVECVVEVPPEPPTTPLPAENPPQSYNDYYGESYDEDMEYDDTNEEAKKRKKRSYKLEGAYRKLLKRFKRQRSRGDEELSYYSNDEDEEEYLSDYNYSYENETDRNTLPSAVTEVNRLSSELLSEIVNNPNLVHNLEVTFTIGGQIALNDTDFVGSRIKHGDMREFFGQLSIKKEFDNRLARLTVRNINTSTTDVLTYNQDSYVASPDELKCPLGAVLRQSATCVNCPVGTYFDVLPKECKSCQRGFYQDLEAQLSCKACPTQTSTAGVHARSREECKDMCSVGTYSSNGLETCIPCPFHSYGDTYGATVCTPCPDNFGTSVRGATSKRQCGRFCEPGYASRDGIVPCYPCPENTYQSQEGAISCYECPRGTSTAGKASDSYRNCVGLLSLLSLTGKEEEDEVQRLYINQTRPFSECYKDPCQNGGSCVSGEAGYLCVCRLGFTGVNCEVDVNECSSSPCKNNAECVDLVNQYNCLCVDGYEGTRCEAEIDECQSSPCLNNASCVDQLASFDCRCLVGFDGIICEENIDECASNPCSNEGLCVDGVAGFECVCVPGFDGSTCEIDVDECASEPCENDALCLDGINNYTCQCLLGFEGDRCQTNIDDCMSSPCQNGSSCVDLVNDFKCICVPSFTGRLCNTKLYPDFDLIFDKPNTYHHVELRDGIGNMTEVTVAFFMKSNNTETSGTPFSYAIGDGVLADVFTLTNLEALTLYVNGEAVVTDTRKLNDGKWYHVIVTWKSEGGEWKIYVNKALEVQGAGLQANTVIPGGGVLVIGEEQDCLGGCFSSSQDFIGTITQFNFFNYVMRVDEVNLLYDYCVDNEGTVKAWPDALGGIMGQIKIIRPASYCTPCPEIELTSHINIEAPKSYIRTLYCDLGFDMWVKSGLTRRRARAQRPRLVCKNGGSWYQGRLKRNDPSSDFLCQRISCERHRDIDFGSALATGSSFNDTVTYRCDSGFRLKGHESIVCQADKTWSARSPACVDINECLTIPCHSMATCMNSIGTYQCVCKTGFTGDGQVCSKVSCGDPGYFENGLISGENFTYGASVHFSCQIGYELVGPNTKFCLSNGLWSNSNPVCYVIECEEPVALVNGVIRKSSNIYLSELIQECDLGFELIGQSTRVCLETRFWSGEPARCDPVTCPQLTPIERGFVNATLDQIFQFKDVVTYHCKPGYRLVGHANIRCTDDGTWSFPTPECTPQSCDPPANISNGYFEVTGFLYNNTVTYSCDDGYFLVGHSKLWCLSSQIWGHLETDAHADLPICSPVSCGHPDNIQNSNFVLTETEDFVYGSFVKYICVSGYTPVGNSKIFCQANGQWNSSENFFNCVPVMCPHPINLENGEITSDYETNSEGFHVFGHSIEFHCREGFYLDGDISSTCQANGAWTNTSLNCEPVSCKIPIPIPKANMELIPGPYISGPHFKSSLRYSCHLGYQFLNPLHRTRTCGSDGQWTGEVPICEIKDCGSPPSPSVNGHMSGTSTIFESQILYFCNEGYYEGSVSNAITCTAEGLWSSTEVPVCSPVQCDPPNKFRNGNFTGNDFTYSKSLNYSCDEGFNMTGLPVRTCRSDGTWSSDAPSCLPVECGMAQEIENGNLNIETTVFESTANYLCLNGYEMTGTSSIKCLWNASWSDKPPRCTPVICGPLPALENGFILGETFHFMGRVYFLCDSGYILHGNNQSLCQANGSWSHPSPKCEAVDCGDPPNVLNAQSDWNGISTIFKTEINLFCLEGFEFGQKNIPTIYCQENGNWSVSSSCFKIQCRNPDLPHYGKIEGENVSSYEFEDNVTYTCDPGYTLIGNTTSTCQGDKSWSSSLPLCEPVDCGEAPIIAHGIKTGNLTTFLSTVTYRCDEGYETSDPLLLRCLDTAEWSHKEPLCAPVRCGLPPAISYGNYSLINNVSDLTHMSEIKYNCLAGYYLVGSNIAHCSSDRTWRHSASNRETAESRRPNCQRITCSPPPLIPHGSAPRHNYTYGEKVMFECERGYEKVNETHERLYCTAEKGARKGFYNGILPDCRPVSCGRPLEISNGYFENNATLFQDEVFYNCNEGYVLSGEEKSVCQANKRWTNTPLCSPRDCGPPPFIANSIRNPISTFYPASVQYQCQEGYVYQGPDSLNCLSSGNWSDSSGILCNPVSCGEIPQVNNATSVSTGNSYTDSVTFACADGFVSVPPTKSNSITLNCRSNGQWDGITFVCHPQSCHAAPEIEHGSVRLYSAYYSLSQLSTVYFPDVIEYSCDRGYVMNGSQLSQCLQDGRFNTTPPVCSAVVCGIPFPVANASSTFSDVTFGHEVAYVCSLGYSFKSDSSETSVHVSFCTENGRWEPKPPANECTRMVCFQPPEIRNGKRIEATPELVYKYGDSVAYRCDPGYEFEDDLFSITCQSDKFWSSLQCNPVNCGSSPCPKNAICSENGQTYPNQSFIRCIPGYEILPLVTSYKIFCQKNAEWSIPFFNQSEIDLTRCQPHSCEAPEDIANGRFFLMDQETFFGSTVTYTCNPGFEMTPESHVTLFCTEERSWGPYSLPMCKPKDCGVLICPENATCTSEGSTFGSVYHVTCNTGHEILSLGSREMTLRCLKTGQWSEPRIDNLNCTPVKCPVPPRLRHGSITSGNKNLKIQYQQSVNYTCDIGFYLNGSSSLTCQADKSYSSASPICIPVNCGLPFKIEFGTVEYSGVNFLQNASYICNSGYNLIGNNLWICSSQGSWVALNSDNATVVPDDRNEILIPPYCDPVSCGEAPFLENGYSLRPSQEILFNQSVSYICEMGFYMTGSSSLVCMEDGNFASDASPICERKSCGQPPGLEHSHRLAHSASGGTALNVFSDQIIYSCQQGFHFRSGVSVVRFNCSSNGSWVSHQEDVCIPVSCGSPPEFDHSILRGINFTFNSTVYYSCEEGYELNGPSSRVCLSSRQWSYEKQPSNCHLVQCQTPTFIIHGHFSGNYSYLSRVTYECDYGYELVVNNSRDESSALTCQANRQWDKNPPSCLPVSCGYPSFVPNSQYLGSSFTYGSEIVYNCDVGYEMQESPIIICQGNGEWSNPKPECQPITCNRPPRVQNSRYKVGDVTFGNIVSYNCDKGYYLQGPSDTLTCTSSKTYDFPTPSCLPVSCGELEDPLNGYVERVTGGLTFMHNATYHCHLGYEMTQGNSNKTITCTADGVWSKSPPTCNPIECGPPPIVANGNVQFESDSYTATAAYNCLPGYEIFGDSVRENCSENQVCLKCQANRMWNANPLESEQIESPHCEPLSCGEPPRIEHGRVVYNYSTFESVAIYSCDEGYELDPSAIATLTCGPNYLWEPRTFPNCQKVSCPHPSEVKHGYFEILKKAPSNNDPAYERNNFFFEDVISYKCNIGYKFSENKTTINSYRAVCTERKVWDRSSPPCDPVLCGNPPQQHHGHLLNPRTNDDSFAYNDVATYRCDDGYEIDSGVNNESITCNFTGRWSKTHPLPCKPICCGVEPYVTHGLVISGERGQFNKSYGTILHYRCFNGYFMIGNDEVRCSSNKTWSPAPVCEPVSCNLPPSVDHGYFVHQSSLYPFSPFDPFPGFEENASVSIDEYHNSGDEAVTFHPLYFDFAASSPERVTQETIIRNRRNPSPEFHPKTEGFVFGDVVHYVCNRGYHHNPSLPDSVTCEETGQWSTPRPLCEIVTCQPLPTIENGQIVEAQFEFGKKLVYECIKGFEFSHDAGSEFVCDETGRFRPVSNQSESNGLLLPTCVAVSCEFAADVPNAVLVNQNAATVEHFFQDVIQYTCNRGYRIRGPSQLTCQANKRFNHPPPTCEPVSCGLPSPMAGSAYNYSGITYTHTAIYSCVAGYERGFDQITCTENGTWTRLSLKCKKINCGFPPFLEFGNVDVNGTEYNNIARYSCLSGYRISGNLTRVCLASGNWSSGCVKCAPVSCQTPQNPPNGYYVAPANHSFGSVVTYSCNEGYWLNGSAYAMCNATGQWTSLPPECKRVSCGFSPKIHNSILPQVEMFFEDQITYECDFGYTISKETALRCTGSGELSGEPPVCIPVPCNDLPTINNSHIASNKSFVFGDLAFFECDTGFEFSSEPLVAECTGNGTFHFPSKVTCHPVQCIELQDLEHGVLLQKLRSYNDTVFFSCNEGYRLEGPAQVTCTANREWSSTPPTCTPVSCGPPPSYPNAIVVDDHQRFTFGMTVQYECVTGYKTPGLNGITKECGANGTYTDGEVICEMVTCPEFIPFFNGRYSVNGQQYLSEGLLTCVDGFRFDTGDESISFYCQANASWSRDFSSINCLPVPCEPISIVPHSEVEIHQQESHKLNRFVNDQRLDHLHYGNRVVYTCHEGYVMEGISTLSCRSDGTWNSQPGVCLPVLCGTPPSVPNAKVLGDNYTFEMQATYICDTGYVNTSSDMTKSCLASGSFSENLVGCERISCLPVPKIKNGTPSAEVGLYNDHVTYECDKGHQLMGNKVLFCDSRGFWIPAPPQCERIQCKVPPTIQFAIVETTGSKYEDVATINCIPGFELNINADMLIATCMVNGEWSVELERVECTPVSCEYISGIQNGDIVIIPPLHSINEFSSSKKSSHVFETRLSFNCHFGHELMGESVISCEANKRWSGPPPQCKPVQCHSPPSFENARLTTNAHIFGTRAVYVCEEGFTLASRLRYLTCNENGTFNDYRISCSPTPCPILPIIENGQIVLERNDPVYRDTAEILCNNGYYLNGSDSIECLSRGVWSEASVRCLPVICGQPPFIANAVPVRSEFHSSVQLVYGDVADYECMSGFYTPEGTITIACTAGGTFQETPAQCNPIVCDDIPQLENAIANATRVFYGETLQISCNPGFRFFDEIQQKNVVCQGEEEWSEDISNLHCQGVDCVALEPLPFGRLEQILVNGKTRNLDGNNLTTFSYPATIKYRCDPGYILVGRSRQHCLTDGTWEGSKPFCEPVDCGQLSRLLHGFIDGTKTTSGSIAFYRCEVGYRLEPLSATTRACQENGSWSGVAPFCKLISCGFHPSVENAIVSNQAEIFYGSSLKITCKKGFTPVGNTTRMCGSDGVFTGPSPVCEIISCGLHPEVPYGVVEPQLAFFYQESVNISCEEGFRLVSGDSHRVCQHDGSWSGIPPICEKELASLRAFNDQQPQTLLSCERPDLEHKNVKLTNEDISIELYESGTELELCCLNSGFLPLKATMITRCENGEWTEIPECLPKCRHRCLHQGKCSQSGKCSCSRGWSGSNCHRPSCPLPCLNGGYCSAPFRCTCPPGWTGMRCQSAECDFPCANGGKCIGPNLCQCPYGYFGKNCSENYWFDPLW